MFGEKPKLCSSPLEKSDHPELDTSGEVDGDVISKNQLMIIGALQWTISLSRFDIATAVMIMSRFHVAPCEGHLDRVKHIYRYLAK